METLFTDPQENPPSWKTENVSTKGSAPRSSSSIQIHITYIIQELGTLNFMSCDTKSAHERTWEDVNQLQIPPRGTDWRLHRQELQLKNYELSHHFTRFSKNVFRVSEFLTPFSLRMRQGVGG